MSHRINGARRGLSVVGDLLLHAERGVAQDFIQAYSRLLEVVGRDLSDVDPGLGMVPFTSTRTGWPVSRVEVVVTVIGAAIRNATARDSERHWREADRAVKGWALAEEKAHDIAAADALTLAENAPDDDTGYRGFMEAHVRHLNLAHWYRSWADPSPASEIRISEGGKPNADVPL